MREGGAKLACIKKQLIQSIKPGVNLINLEQKAVKLINRAGGKPSFQLVPGYNCATCITVNEEIVHGIPKDRVLSKKDLVTIDIGIYYRGFHTDTATTVVVGQASDQDKKFLSAGKEALKKAIDAACLGNRVGHISRAMQDSVEAKGYNCVELLTGHGIGKQLHEEPPIPCLLKTRVEETAKLKKGQTLAIEVIYTQGKPDLHLKEDGWTYITQDRSKAAVFEETIVLTNKKAEILTKEPSNK
jgi:methionyl aminopeptidase